MAAFAVLRGLLMVPDAFGPGYSPFPAVGGGKGGGGLWAVYKVESSVHSRTWPSEVYPAGKLQ